ncbi:hypothetical protein Pelo_18052 [Pelomyxa schiedti]|nr:hypothetical protein Pelo_18052 [Pelomyxa schiedti]
MGEPDSILQYFILKNLQSHVTPSDFKRRLALVFEDSKIAGDLVMEFWKLLVTESLEVSNSTPITTAPTPPSAPATKPMETESVVNTLTNNYRWSQNHHHNTTHHTTINNYNYSNGNSTHSPSQSYAGYRSGTCAIAATATSHGLTEPKCLIGAWCVVHGAWGAGQLLPTVHLHPQSCLTSNIRFFFSPTIQP